MSRQALGKGLGALIPVKPQEESKDFVSEIDVDAIVPSRFQPRIVFKEESLEELAKSIKEQGVIQPIIVTKKRNGYELIAGERRWRAVKSLGLKKIPAIVKLVRDSDALEMAIIENIQRENLNPIEEALAYERLMNEFAFTQENLATKVGKSRPAVANSLRLLKLPEKIRDDLSDGKITTGHARAILALPSETEQLKLLDEILRAGLNVRAVESKIKNGGGKTGFKGNGHKDPVLEQTAINLERRLGAKVDIKKSAKGGQITIRYSNDDELNRIIDLVGA